MKSSSIFLVLFTTSMLICSCKKNPATTLEGTYEGTFMLDSATTETGTTNVVVVNPLTVSFTVNVSSMPSFAVNDIAVLGDIEPYTLDYDGFQGILTGSADDSSMSWVLMRSTDTIAFTGTRQ